MDRMQKYMPRIIFRVVGSGCAVTAKSTLGDSTVWQAAEYAAHMLIFVDYFGSLFDHYFNSGLIAEPVGTFDSIEHVQFPAVDRFFAWWNGL